VECNLSRVTCIRRYSRVFDLRLSLGDCLQVAHGISVLYTACIPVNPTRVLFHHSYVVAVYIVSTWAIGLYWFAMYGYYVGFPKNWEMQSMECQVFYVDPVSREFDRRKSHFLRSHPSAHVYHIQRIQNKLLWRKYLNKKKQLEDDHTLQSSGEKMLYHGTRDTRPEQIYEGDSGFDMRYSRDGLWGKGNYFAVNSTYSVGYSHKTTDGYQQMLVARVLTGASFRSAQKRFQVPPLREGTGQGEGEVQRRYDSVQGETNGSTVYITYDNDHSYPEYLITFKP